MLINNRTVPKILFDKERKYWAQKEIREENSRAKRFLFDGRCYHHGTYHHRQAYNNFLLIFSSLRLDFYFLPLTSSFPSALSLSLSFAYTITHFFLALQNDSAVECYHRQPRALNCTKRESINKEIKIFLFGNSELEQRRALSFVQKQHRRLISFDFFFSSSSSSSFFVIFVSILASFPSPPLLSLSFSDDQM